MLKFIAFDERLIILLTFWSVISAAPQGSLPDVEPVRLSYSCVRIVIQGDEDKDLTPVMLLHGVADSSATWHGLQGAIATETKRQVCAPDFRNHGHSPWTDVFNFDILPVDLDYLMEENNISKVILVGHSMGGVAAMKFALAKPEKVEKLVVEDFPPRQISPDVGSNVLLLVKLLNESLEYIQDESNLHSAKLAVRDYIINRVPPEVAVDIVTEKEVDYLPLVLGNSGYRWLTNIDVLIATFEKPDTVLSPFTGEYRGETLFIYGTKSPLKVYEGQNDTLKLFPKAQFHPVEGASHYIHPRYREFLTTVLKFIKGD